MWRRTYIELAHDDVVDDVVDDAQGIETSTNIPSQELTELYNEMPVWKRLRLKDTPTIKLRGHLEQTRFRMGSVRCRSTQQRNATVWTREKKPWVNYKKTAAEVW